ncbi:MAG: ACT domain-containing protein [Clostridia bacterium]|nr:ACT domain-containing protein [Clostridia bacterium]
MDLGLLLYEEKLAVCRLAPEERIPEWAANSAFYSVTRTSEELSVVCMEGHVPEGVLCEKDWRMYKIEGILDFSLIGILSRLSTLLAQQGISIFAISTYNTDYILVKNGNVDTATKVFRSNGISVKTI